MSKYPWNDHENETKRRELNRRIFLIILETLQYLAGQEFDVRGDDDDESNFIQLLRLQRHSLNSKISYQKRYKDILVMMFRMRL